MFIDRNVSENLLRSNERNGAGVVKFLLDFRSFERSRRGLALQSINTTPLRGETRYALPNKDQDGRCLSLEHSRQLSLFLQRKRPSN
jgi:hypothetical protein